MRKFATLFLLLSIIFATEVSAQSNYRRGTSPYTTFPSAQYYIIDSDDNLPVTPTFNWTDTTYNRAQWTKVTGFTANEAGYAALPTSGGSMDFEFYDSVRTLPSNLYVSTSGTLYYRTEGSVMTSFASQNNSALQTNPLIKFIAPLWGPTMFIKTGRTAGDSSSVWVRSRTDSLFVNFYNVFLKGTNGQVSATFQVVFSKNDSTITFNYKSFNGSYAGIPAAKLFQDRVTIGIQNTFATWYSMYLDRGLYYAKGTSAIYNQGLHDGLTVRLTRFTKDFLRMTRIDAPNKDGLEMSSNQFYPTFSMQNLSDSSAWIYFRYALVNIGTNTTLYNRSDSLYILFRHDGTKNGDVYTLACGQYRLTVNIDTDAKKFRDPWIGNNTLSRTFSFFNNQSFPFYEDWTNGFNYCAWANAGAEVKPGAEVMYDPIAPRSSTSGALVLDRRDRDGIAYIAAPIGGDTVTSAPINMAGKSNVWLQFAYQRGLMSDTVRNGILNTVSTGPDAAIVGSSGLDRQGDTLFIEAIPSNSPSLNPADSLWEKIGYIPAGLDVSTQRFRMQVSSTYIHDHSRFRFRVHARSTTPNDAVLPVEDPDSWVIDAISLSSPTSGQSDFETSSIDLGNHNFTHIPRDIATAIIPTLKINNNGFAQTQALFLARTVVKDALNRAVYDKTTSFNMPTQRGDTTVKLPFWDIKGTQGGKITTSVLLDQLYTDYNHKNDTNTFTRTFYIDDSYGWDDGTPDTVGTTVKAPTDFQVDFTPLSTDSLRGASFYFLNSTSAASWTVTVKDTSATIATRNLSISTSGTGFFKGTFAPVRLSVGKTYRIRFTETSANDIGGDASKTLNWQTSSLSTGLFKFLYPEVVHTFRTPTDVPYDSVVTNANYGNIPLLPMVRLVYSGSATYLPVELVSLSAQRKYDGSVAINWRTASELKVARFEIERQNGDEWNAIGASLPRGATTGAEYNVNDVAAPRSEVMYRLMEYDLDGSAHMLGQVNASALIDSRLTDVQVYPNPAKTQVRVRLTGVTPDQLRIVDPLGRTVTELVPEGSEAMFETTQLPAGYYFMEAVTAGTVTRVSFAVVK